MWATQGDGNTKYTLLCVFVLFTRAPVFTPFGVSWDVTQKFLVFFFFTAETSPRAVLAFYFRCEEGSATPSLLYFFKSRMNQFPRRHVTHRTRTTYACGSHFFPKMRCFTSALSRDTFGRPIFSPAILRVDFRSLAEYRNRARPLRHVCCEVSKPFVKLHRDEILRPDSAKVLS